MESREPRLAVFGRRGAGKSSLINAVFGDNICTVGSIKAQTAGIRWYTYRDPRGGLKILDTRGLGEGHRPTENTTSATALDEIKKAIDGECPDAILFLIKAKEVDARIDEDLQALTEVTDYIKKNKGYDVSVVGVVTQVDEVDPKQIPAPFDHPRKRQNIETAMELLRGKLTKALRQESTVIPISAYMEFEGSRVVHDERWNVDALLEFLIERLPKSAQVQLARISRVASIQKKIARIVIGASATLAAGIAAVPLPFADLLPLVAIQTTMIVGVGYVAGRQLDTRAATEFVSALGLNVGAGLVFREVARGLIKVVFPGGGSVASR